jgi:hypothetical protein
VRGVLGGGARVREAGVVNFNPARLCEDCGGKFFPGPNWRRRFCNACRARRVDSSKRRSRAQQRNQAMSTRPAHDEKRRAKYAANRTKGLCGRCGSDVERGAYCNDCRGVHAKARNATRAKARAAGIGTAIQSYRENIAKLGENLVARVKVFTAEERAELARKMGVGVSK